MKTKFSIAILIFLFSPIFLISQERVSFLSEDGVKIVGKYFSPKSSDKLVFILLHGLGSGKEEWNDLEKLLSKEGFGYFAYDLRGHNESIKNIKDYEVNYKDFRTAGEWYVMIKDLGLAVNFLCKRKNIQRNKIGLVGASLGANISLNYAANSKDVPIVVLLSPGLNYAGITTDESIQFYGNRPLCIASSPGDKYSFESCKKLISLAPKNNRIIFYQGKGNAHGVKMFDGEFEFKIINWIKKQQGVK